MSVFNLSTLELDNALHRLSFAESFEGNSAKEWVQVGRIVQKWVQDGCKFEMREKEKSRKSLTYRTLSFALQDGLGFKKMKFIETFINHKKLKYR